MKEFNYRPYFCDCGCKEICNYGKRFVSGHNNRGKNINYTKPIFNLGWFEKGHLPWSVGLTKETDERISKTSKSIKLSWEREKGLGIKRKGGLKTHSSWCKGLTKETDDRVKRNAQSVKVSWGKEKELGIKRKIGGKKGHISWSKGLTKADERIRKSVESAHTEHSLKKLSNALRLVWAKYSEEEKSARIKKGLTTTKPNKEEVQFFGEVNFLFPNEYALNTKGEILTIGGKVPDVVNVNGQKKLFELYGNFYHKYDNPEDRINYFKQFGWGCLIIWASELADKMKLREKLLAFHNKP